MLAISTSTVTALGLGEVTLILSTLVGALLPSLRRHCDPALLLPLTAVIIAGFATVIDLWLQASSYGLYQRIGIFIPLLASQSLIFAFTLRLEQDAGTTQGMLSGLSTGCAFFAAIVLLGAIRELLTSGAILADMHLIVPDVDWRIALIDTESRFSLIQTAPGAFISLAIVIACMNAWRQRNRHRGAIVIDDDAR